MQTTTHHRDTCQTYADESDKISNHDGGSQIYGMCSHGYATTLLAAVGQHCLHQSDNIACISGTTWLNHPAIG